MISLVSLGPGGAGLLTDQAREHLLESDVVLGYRKYVDRIRPLLADRSPRLRGFPIGEETHRARESIRLAEEGEWVALVSSGDVGVYGMAAALFETLDRDDAPDVKLTICPGVSALNAASALLGAPVGQDFAAISLSDHLTPWDTIARRVRHAAAGDFIIVFYNPRSSQRPHQLSDAIDLIRHHRAPGTPVGVVRQAYRPEEETRIVELNRVPTSSVDMVTTLIVGNSRTRRYGNWMYTPRGYHRESVSP